MGADDEDGFQDGTTAEKLLSEETQRQLKQFLSEYHQYYDWGCPPSEGWTIEDCLRFNSEYKRIFCLVAPELAEQFIICQEQLDLMEEPELLAELNLRGRDFVQERKAEYAIYWDDET